MTSTSARVTALAVTLAALAAGAPAASAYGPYYRPHQHP
jgi:hypothetical protein